MPWDDVFILAVVVVVIFGFAAILAYASDKLGEGKL